MKNLCKRLVVVMILVAALALMATPTMAWAQQPGSSEGSDVAVQVNRNLELARLFRAVGDYPRATDLYLKVIDLDRTNEEAWLGLAWINNAKKDYGTAALAALIVLKKNPENSIAWRELGYAHWKRGKTNDAIIALTQAIEANSRNFPAYDYLASLLDENGMPAMAAVIRAKKAEAQKRSTLIEI